MLAKKQVRNIGIGFLVTLYFLFYKQPQSLFLNKKKILIVSLSLFLLLVIFFILKRNSTDGRALIYQIAYKAMLDNFPFGAGYGHFSFVFNHEQATYFTHHSIVNKTALLANDGYYPLNEFLYIGIEFGILGLVTMLVLFFLIMRKIFLVYKKQSLSELKIYPALYFTSLFICCLFSYPLHFLLVNLLSLIALNILFDFSISLFLKKILGQYTICACFLIACILIGFGNFLIKYYNNSTLYKQAIEEVGIGYKANALNKLKNISDNYTTKYGFTENYAKTLYSLGETKEAIFLMEKNHEFICNHNYHSLLGNWYKEVQDSIKAEKNLEIALYIAPQYLKSRLDLLNFYASIKNINKAKFWAKQILDCPIKIPNQKANTIKNIAKSYLQNHF